MEMIMERSIRGKCDDDDNGEINKGEV